MSQNDLTIADQSFPSFRSDLNSALQALASLSSSASAPTVSYANQLWYETDADTLWIRNEGNTAWLDLMRISQTTGSPSFMAGNVGIGTVSPGRALHVKNTTPSIRIEDTDTGVSTIYAEIEGSTNGNLIFKADPANASVASGSSILFEIDNGERLRIAAQGSLGIAGANYGTAGQPLVSGGPAATVAWGPILATGTYTPTLTNGVNVAASASFVTQYSRVGDMVTVFGSLTIDATNNNTDSALLMSLPIASTLGSASKLSGVGASTSATKYGESIAFTGDVATNQASILLRPTGIANYAYSFSFSYQVI